MHVTDKLFQVMLGYDAVETGKWILTCYILCSFHLILLHLTTPKIFLTTENYEAPHYIISTLRKFFYHLTTYVCIQRQLEKHHYKLIFYI